jgi:hypothetical protein
MVDNISINELIISCESCGTVKKFKVNSQVDCDKIYHNFRCENNCGRSLYSFIEVGTIERNSLSTQIKKQYAAASD